MGGLSIPSADAPADLPREELDDAATLRCKDCLGMDEYEMRSWNGWHRHMLFVFIAHLFTLEIRIRFSKKVNHAAGLSFNQSGFYPGPGIDTKSHR